MKKFHNAKLQGPAPDPKSKKSIVSLVTSFASNFETNHISKKAENLLTTSIDEKVKEVFHDTRVVLALRQPKNILRHITATKFQSVQSNITENYGLFKCDCKRCLLCKYYIVECTSFKTSNNINWEIKCHITCNSKNVIYFLTCLCCNYETYTGKTNVFRLRMNNHISEIRTGNSTDRFDNHVMRCKEQHNITKEPFFKIYAFIILPSERLLIPYEKHFHSLKFDTMN